jgi:hypothetical protein
MTTAFVSLAKLYLAASDLETAGDVPAGVSDWVEKNGPLVYAFAKEALRIAAVRKHYSARTIVEVIRHESAIADTQGKGFKVNNNRAPHLARVFAKAYPNHAALFSMRG